MSKCISRPQNNPKLKDLLPYKGVLLDIDDTIYDYQSAHRLAIASVYTKIQDVIENVDEDAFQRSYRAERTRITEKHAGTGASRSRFLALQAVFEAMAVPNAYVHAKVAEDHYWHVLVANMTPNVPLIDTLKQFSALGRPICAVTDMQVRIQVEKIIILGLQTEITHMVSSEEVGVEKPDGIMFKTAISKLGLNVHELLMIGDSPSKDIEGAKQFGISSWLIPEYTR